MIRALLGAVVAILVARQAAGHDTWILPKQPAVPIGRSVAFDLTSGMAFPANDVPVRPDRLSRAAYRLNESIFDLLARTAGKKALTLNGRFPTAGVAAVWFESKPRSLELTPDQVRHYLEEIGAWESVGRRWESEGRGRWRESYTKHAKTYVRVGRPEQDDSWARPVGMELELVPEKDPTRLAVGEEFHVRLLENGRPVPDLAIGLQAAKEKKGELLKTDSEGRARIQLDQSGWWLIRATVLRPSSKPDLDWETRFTTLTIFIGVR
ncbi:MAG: DUF4198 domain-containing protein [Thermoanaerobaculia bacterium]